MENIALPKLQPLSSPAPSLKPLPFPTPKQPSKCPLFRYSKKHIVITVLDFLHGSGRSYRPSLSTRPAQARGFAARYGNRIAISFRQDQTCTAPTLLERTLGSLNSASWECNLQMNSANLLNLKLFHPPKPLALPVADYAVPIFLRRDWQVLSYEWDLAIY